MRLERRSIIEPAFALWRLAPRYVLVTALRRFAITLLAFMAFGALLMTGRSDDHPLSLAAAVAGGAVIMVVSSLVAIGVWSLTPQEAIIEGPSLLLVHTRFSVRRFLFDSGDTIAIRSSSPKGNLLELRAKRRRYLMVVTDADLEAVTPLLNARSEFATREPSG